MQALKDDSETTFRPAVEPPDFPTPVLAFFNSLTPELQARIVRLFDTDVIETEMLRRGSVEPLLSCEQLALILDLSVDGLYKKLRRNELGIPFLPLGKGGGYRFDPKDVRGFINRVKVRPVQKPMRLRQRKRP